MVQEYQVIRTQEIMRPAPSGQLEKTYRLTITTRGQNTLSVDIPEVKYNPAEAARILKEKAANADEISKLTG